MYVVCPGRCTSQDHSGSSLTGQSSLRDAADVYHTIISSGRVSRASHIHSPIILALLLVRQHVKQTSKENVLLVPLALLRQKFPQKHQRRNDATWLPADKGAAHFRHCYGQSLSIGPRLNVDPILQLGHGPDGF